jgi:hypothetical protein
MTDTPVEEYDYFYGPISEDDADEDWTVMYHITATCDGKA